MGFSCEGQIWDVVNLDEHLFISYNWDGLTTTSPGAYIWCYMYTLIDNKENLLQFFLFQIDFKVLCIRNLIQFADCRKYILTLVSKFLCTNSNCQSYPHKVTNKFKALVDSGKYMYTCIYYSSFLGPSFSYLNNSRACIKKTLKTKTGNLLLFFLFCFVLFCFVFCFCFYQTLKLAINLKLIKHIFLNSWIDPVVETYINRKTNNRIMIDNCNLQLYGLLHVSLFLLELFQKNQLLLEFSQTSKGWNITIKFVIYFRSCMTISTDRK